MVAAAVLLAMLWWVVDALLDAFVFFPGGFGERFITDVPPHELYVRLVGVGLILVFGGLCALFVRRLAGAGRRTDRLNDILRAMRNVLQLITRQTDEAHLLDETCRLLLETRGWYNAWIARTDESGAVTSTHHAGFGDDFAPMAELLATGRLPPCARRALASPGVQITPNPPADCPDCPLARNYAGRGAMTVRLKHGGRVFGWLVASVPACCADEPDERQLLGELAADLAYALDSLRGREALHESERRLAQAQQVARIGSWEWDTATGWISASAEIRRILGLEETAELTAERLRSLVHPEDRRCWDEAMTSSVKPGSHGSVNVRMVRADGSVLWAHVQAERTRDAAGAPVVTGILQDTTARTRAEQTVERSENLLRRVVDTSPTLIFVKDADGRYLLANRTLADLYGTTPGQMLGRTDAEFAENGRLEAKEAADYRADDVEVARTRRPRWIPAEPMTGPDGTTRWFETVKVPLELEGNANCVLGISVDITDRKRAEQQLLQAQKMEAIGQLAGGVAHDFRNQLTVIKGFADMLRRRGEVAESGREKLDQILKAAERSAHLTRQLLVFGRKEVLQPEVVDLYQLVRELAKTLPRLLGEDVRLNLEPSSRPCCAELDPGLFDQALINLAVNARDAMPTGGTLSIRVERTVPDAGEQPRAVVTVADDGVGMDAETRARIFEPFFTTRQAGGGTGLGLATVYGFVTQSGGTIECHSEPGAGTTFRLSFPSVDVARLDRGAAEDSGQAPRGEGTVLVVEDEESVRKLVVDALREGGYTVVETANADEALPEGEHYDGRIDLLVTDLVMPGMNGTELAERVRTTRPDVRVLYLTGYADEELRRRGFEDVAHHVLVKPFTPGDLLEQVRAVLSAAEPRQSRKA
ncbi:MAG: PAS domain S-box protein [Planctomycetota bacterium]